jgi:predicted metal-dependent HD superfamily phosphohydrolase
LGFSILSEPEFLLYPLKRAQMQKLSDDVEQYVKNLLGINRMEDLVFHSLEHTIEVVDAAREIATASNLDPTEMQVLLVAAWFHDCGYIFTYTGHEDESKRIAGEFLQLYGCSTDFIDKVLDCIEATRFPQQEATTIIAAILCDADLYHFTRPGYPVYERALRHEFKVFLNKTYSDREWNQTNLSVLRNHTYKSDYGAKILQQFKEVNIHLLEAIQA